jgi:hypothetical protein
LRQDAAEHASSVRPDQLAHAAPEGSPTSWASGPPSSRSRLGSARPFRPPEPPGPSQIGKAR